ncbi:Centromere protein I [Aphis craccivora]|uniref:Centromere protein I n=1 Tax=Aphis craccivora TaxID=307492 RepID=A0A6G0ZJE6_APHCR|nr:Centromere protein I [Aphis craccivora]
MSDQVEDYHYDRSMFFNELKQSIERNKLSTNVLFSNYLNDFKDIVQHNGLVHEEMNIVCQLLCTVNLSVQNFKRILLTLVPEEPSIPHDICEELIVWALSAYRLSANDGTKAQCIFYWLLYVVEEKLTNMDVIDKYYKVLFHLCNYENVNQPVAGIIYCLTKSDDVQKWMITCCKNIIEGSKSEPHLNKLLNFFESPNSINNIRQKGLFDGNNTFCKELACGLRSVRKELMNIHPQFTHTQQERRSSVKLYSKIQFVDVNNKFEFPSTEELAKSFMKEGSSNNSLILLGNVSGWCKLLMNNDKELNLQHRFSNNLYHSLDQIFLSNEIVVKPLKRTKFLQEILEFQKFAHRGLTAVNMFIFQYIISWDGMENSRIIYELFEYLSFTSEEELKHRFLEKLYAIFITGDELIYRMVINSLTNLLCNLYFNSKQTRTNKNCTLFGEELREETEFEIVKCLTKYISHWCSICIYNYPQEEQLKHTVYTFFEKVSVLENLKPSIWPIWTIMPPSVFYNGLMSVNIYWLDRLSKLMLRHIKVDTDRIEDIADNTSILRSLQLFDLYMADFYNALHAGELFEKREEGFIFKYLKEKEVEKDFKIVNLNICFQMEKHIALAPYFMNAMHTVEDPLDLIQTEAPNLHKLILTLNENLQNDTENEMSIN